MNLADAIAKYERVSKSVPRIMLRIHDQAFENFAKNFEKVGAKVLAATVDSEDAEAAQEFVRGFTAENLGLMMKFTVRGKKTDSTQQAPESGELTAKAVEDWVRAGYEDNPSDNTEGKMLDERDRDIDEVTYKMQQILLYSGNSPSAKQAHAITKYTPLIQKFMERHKIQNRNGWASIVLHAWMEYVAVVWPAIAKKNLHSLVMIGH
jgi:glutamate synthase domain-containing protein 2